MGDKEKIIMWIRGNVGEKIVIKVGVNVRERKICGLGEKNWLFQDEFCASVCRVTCF